MLMKVQVVCGGRVEKEVIEEVVQEGDLEALFHEAVSQWRKEKSGRTLFSDGCYVRVDRSDA